MAKKLILLLLAVLPFAGHSNALVLNNIAVNQAAQTVTFTVSWQNSWRVGVVPFNWDAVWLFVKFRQCGVDPNTEWTPGTVNLAGSTIPAALQSTMKDGTAGIDPDNFGLMLRQSVAGVYPAAGPYTITMNITNMPTDAVTTPVDVKAFGIEMVFIPGGAYQLGDGVSQFAFTITNVANENAATLNFTAGLGSVNLPATYPKGTNAMYCMKYEMSQGQYAEFLNTIPASYANNRFTNRFTAGYRNSVNAGGVAPDIYQATYPDRAQNYLLWPDLAAYLDWSGLRPMTELEFEKICRGSGPVTAQEYAWGSTTIVQAQTLSTTVPSENGTEVFTAPVNANVVYAGFSFNGGVVFGAQGPARVGIFALPTTSTRQAAGATFYGVMEMSGNVLEWVVPASTNASTYTATLGNGLLNATGDHNVATWPGPTAPINTTPDLRGGDNNRYIGARGGGWDNAATELRVSERYYCRYNRTEEGRGGNGYYSLGGRGVR